LHALYDAEEFLDDFKRREKESNFDVVFSRNFQNIFAHASRPENEPTRRILIKHLATSLSSPLWRQTMMTGTFMILGPTVTTMLTGLLII
jgi:hypothetical protein